jgi:hypothetical protein
VSRDFGPLGFFHQTIPSIRSLIPRVENCVTLTLIMSKAVPDWLSRFCGCPAGVWAKESSNVTRPVIQFYFWDPK